MGLYSVNKILVPNIKLTLINTTRFSEKEKKEDRVKK